MPRVRLDRRNVVDVEIVSQLVCFDDNVYTERGGEDTVSY